MSRRWPTRDNYDVQYTKLVKEPSGNTYICPQFDNPPESIPWKAITFAISFLLAGAAMLIMGGLIVSGFLDAKYADRMWPIIVLGLLTFAPGVYHVYIACCAYHRYPGFTFDQIPSY